jgi:cyanophycinase
MKVRLDLHATDWPQSICTQQGANQVYNLAVFQVLRPKTYVKQFVWRFAMKAFATFLCALFAAFPAVAAKQYSYFRVGSANDTSTATTPGTVLMGGGTDVDAAFEWMCQRSGAGDFLVIRATGTDAYNPYIQSLCPNENSVATLIIPNRTAANDPFVVNAIQKAEALWIAGGDQSNYVNFWKGAPVETELNNLIARGAPIGGTSAGMNVLSEFLYSALASQGVTSSQALADPFSRYITLDRDFVNISIVHGLLDDPHFVTRDRMGRDLAFMCRVFLNGWSSTPRDIAIDEQTALLIDASGRGTVVGNSTVYFMQAPAHQNSVKPKRRSPTKTSPSTESMRLAHSTSQDGPALAVLPTPSLPTPAS